METKIFLDIDDVRSIAAQRSFNIPGRKRRLIFELIPLTLSILLILTGTITAMAQDIEGIVCDQNAEIYIAGGGFFIFWVVVSYILDKPFRQARRGFIEHWQKTGELPPRWPARNGGER